MHDYSSHDTIPPIKFIPLRKISRFFDSIGELKKSVIFATIDPLTPILLGME